MIIELPKSLQDIVLKGRVSSRESVGLAGMEGSEVHSRPCVTLKGAGWRDVDQDLCKKGSSSKQAGPYSLTYAPGKRTPASCISC